MPKAREIKRQIERALASLPVVALTGMRQVGKTTLLRVIAQERGARYETLDDFATLESATRSPEAFLGADDRPVAIDEAQKAPALFPVIKRLVDGGRTPGRFLLSGSANFALLGGITESLAGRAVYFPLHPFSRREVAASLDAEPFVVRALRHGLPVHGGASAEPVSVPEVMCGGMPPVCLEPGADPDLWFLGYEQTYLERDIRQISQIGDLVAFRHLLRLAGMRTGQVLNMSELARDAHLNVATATRHFSAMEASFVISRLPPYLGSRVTRLIKSPKIFVSDSGLASHLAGIARDVAERDAMWGRILETYVHQNLAAVLSAWEPGARLHFWNVQGRYEVDFVIEVGQSSLAIEVKAGSRWQDRDLAGLRTLLSATRGCKAGILAYGGDAIAPLGDGIWAVPLGVLLS